MFPSNPHLVDGGVSFRIYVDGHYGRTTHSSIRDCFIPTDTLLMLAERRGGHWDAEETFQHLEPVILGVARRLAHAGVGGKPLRLERSAFH
jgi:hypothetical protein